MLLQEVLRKSDEEMLMMMMNLTFDLSVYLTMHELGFLLIKT